MCGTCGCGSPSQTRITNLQTGKDLAMARESLHNHDHDHHHDQNHNHDHDHGHDHHHGHHHHDEAPSAVVTLEAQILAKNDALAARNRGWFAGREILALNLVSSPGSGKTSLLERTIRDLRDTVSISVIEGDQATAHDGERIRAAGAPAIQVNTGADGHSKQLSVRVFRFLGRPRLKKIALARTLMAVMLSQQTPVRSVGVVFQM